MDQMWVGGTGNFSNAIKVSQDGRVIYLPEIIPPDREQASAWKGSWAVEFPEDTWILPANWRELAWAVRQAAGGRLSLELGAPDWVAVEVVEKENLLMVHLVNYKLGNKLSGIPVDLEVGRGKSVRRVQLLSPDRGVPAEDLKFSLEQGRCRFSVPRLEVYDMLVVELER
jgi:hypothetical protein